MSFKQLKIACLQADPRSANQMGNERLEKLIHNIRRTALIPPIIVRPHPDLKNMWIIIDGHYRVKAQEALGQDTIPAVIWDVNEQEAGLLLATLNRLRGEDHPQKRAELLQELMTTFDAVDLAKLLPESEEDIRKIVAQLEAEDQELDKLIQRQISEEAGELPETLHFILSHQDAKMVREALLTFDEDVNRAIVLICKQVTKDDDEQ